MNRPHYPDHLHSSRARERLQGAVFVQADCRPEEGLAEVAWVTQLAEQEGLIQGIVAFAPLELGDDARPVLEQLSQNKRVKGVRRLIQGEAAGFATQPAFVKGVSLLAEFDLSFDLCLFHHQLPEAIELVSRCPDGQFVLDHFGKPAIKRGEFDVWAADITRLAEYERVFCKLSGLVTEADHQHWTVDGLRPYVDHVLDTFGPQRVMFGSDWPVCTLAADYDRWLAAADALTAGCSPSEREGIFVGNARRFYRLVPVLL